MDNALIRRFKRLLPLDPENKALLALATDKPYKVGPRRDIIPERQAPNDVHSAWHGMESAPKDGTRVLLAWADGWVNIGKWITIECESKWGDDPSAPSSRSGWSEDRRDVSWLDSHPICWTPLPSIPSWLKPMT